MRLTKQQLAILQHALGVNEYGQLPRGHSDFCRNHFCAGGKDEAICRELVELGYMKTFTRSFLPYYNCTVTEAGMKAMREESLKPPKLTRSQTRDRTCLKADPGLKFGEWLKRQRDREIGVPL